MTKTCEVTSRPNDDRAGELCGDDATHLFEAPWATRLVCDAHARQYAIEGRMVWPLDAKGNAIKPVWPTKDEEVAAKKLPSDFPSADDAGETSSPTWRFGHLPEEPSPPSRPPLRQALADVAVALLDLAKDKVTAWRKT